MEYVKGTAWADYVNFWYNGKHYRDDYSDDACQPYPFGYFLDNSTNGQFEFRIGGISMSHEDLRYTKPVYNDKGEKLFEKKKSQYEGRVYLRDKLIVFWDGIPDKATLRKILLDISNGFRDDLDMEVKFNDFLLCGNNKGNACIVSVNEYLGLGNSNITAQKKQQSQLAYDERLGQSKLTDWEMNDPHADRMYRNVVEESEEIDFDFSPDGANIPDIGRISWHNDDAHPFGIYDDGEMLVGEDGETHNSMVWSYKYGYEQSPHVGYVSDYEWTRNSANNDWTKRVDSNDNYIKNSFYDNEYCSEFSGGISELSYPGRFWTDAKVIIFWYWDSSCTRQKIKEIIDLLEAETDIDFYDYTLLYPIKEGYRTVGGMRTTVREFITGQEGKIDNSLDLLSHNRSEYALAKERGRQELNNAVLNNPYMDKMYKNVMEKKKEKKITEAALRKMIAECITDILKQNR